ncbi:PIG-L family deacetylase [Paenibacillus sp. FSL H7-0331]|uniref:PIG-L family deacetylase n=1 Tax=Paenibacillus sp. FSL H7-0331 TaxID=1920421 RepID=UPI00096FDEE8|nr:PIG-L family deacetylase [Paenibacillus sp. FSL H7-0331]OMF13534.1 hypothetical protein BK127_20035 [Paenibacillus sp. FSL H7-0331]
MSVNKILVVVAHPDDESFICGGTLAKYAKQGSEVTVICATKGELGRRLGKRPFTVSRESMRRVREGEMREACRALGVQRLEFLDILDKTVEFEEYEGLKQRIIDFIEDIQPDVVLTFHEKLGGHPDHCAIGKATKGAYLEAVTRPDQARYLYFITYGDEIKGFDLSPDVVSAVNIRCSLQEKLSTYRAHRSQSDVHKWAWQSDEQAILGVSPIEYFIRFTREGAADVLGDAPVTTLYNEGTNLS